MVRQSAAFFDGPTNQVADALSLSRKTDRI